MQTFRRVELREMRISARHPVAVSQGEDEDEKEEEEEEVVEEEEEEIGGRRRRVGAQEEEKLRGKADGC